MKIINSLNGIIKEIIRKSPNNILIDGVDGSGKSTLANGISEKLSIVHFNLDDYLEKDRGYIVDYINYDLLKQEIEDVCCPIIIDGVCTLAVLANLQIKCDLHVYVKRMSVWGFWYDSNLDDIGEDLDSFINEQNTQRRNFDEINAQISGELFNPKESAIPTLTEELIRYHFEFKPQKIADVIYERSIGD